MKRKRNYTLIVASDAERKLWRISLPSTVIHIVVVLALVGVLTAGTAGFHYGRMLWKVVDYDHVLSENDSFRAENHEYRIQTAQLGEKIDFLETMAKKLIVLTGMNSGIGGFSKENLSQPRPASAGTLPAIDNYNKTVAALEESYRAVEDFASEKALVESARPAFPPVNGYITQGMGRRVDPFNPSATDYHSGVDISAPHGSRVIAPADGTVLFAGMRAGYGNMVVIDHKFGYTTRYAHLSKVNVRAGQRVSRHDIIGYVGNSGRSTGSHLHYEVWLYNRPVNPMKFILPQEQLAARQPQVVPRPR